MLGFFCKKSHDLTKYRIQTSSIEDNFNGYIVQKYQEGAMPSGYTSWYWRDVAKFKTLEEAKEALSHTQRETIYLEI